jgi:cell division protein FtsQ
MKIFRKTAIWIILVIYLVLVAAFAGNHYENQLCNGIDISIEDSLETRFLSRNDILHQLELNNMKYLGITLNKIDLDTIEKIICENQIVSNCNAYTSINGILHVDIRQRTPFVRIIEKNGKGYYLDEEGNVLNLSRYYSPHVLVVNGYINTSVKVGQPVNVLELPVNGQNSKLKEIYELTSYIHSSQLWDAQILQVYVNKSGEYELVPRIGAHIIILGSLQDYHEKFEKLEIFYKEGLNKLGWNQYITINLKYKDQVVCTKI